MIKENVVICPPCGEQPLAPEGFNPGVASATKRGANKAILVLPRLTAVLPPQGGQIAARGFTLIELLVVVLIIGILAAVALPQYQVAVAKARIKRNLPIWRSVLQASQAYYLANGKYTCDMDVLDVNSDYIEKAEKEGTSNVCDVRYKYTMKDGNSFSLNGYAIYADMGNVQITIYDNDTNRVCFASEDDDPVGEKVCKSLGTLRAGAKSNHNTNIYDF